jgi:hypothetical protein
MREIKTAKRDSDDPARLFAELTNQLEHAHELSATGQNRLLFKGRQRSLIRAMRRRLTRCDRLLDLLTDLLDLQT